VARHATEPWIERIKRFVRSSLVGALAAILDFVVLELCVRALGLAPWVGKVVAVTVGTTTQFVGSRYYAFRAERGHLPRQMRWFLVVELVGFWVNVGAFRVLERYAHLPIELATIFSGSISYFGFSYPIWHWVFRLTPEDLARASQPEAS